MLFVLARKRAISTTLKLQSPTFTKSRDKSPAKRDFVWSREGENSSANAILFEQGSKMSQNAEFSLFAATILKLLSASAWARIISAHFFRHINNSLLFFSGLWFLWIVSFCFSKLWLNLNRFWFWLFNFD